MKPYACIWDLFYQHNKGDWYDEFVYKAVVIFDAYILFRAFIILITFDKQSDSKDHGANMGPTWGWQDPVGPYVGPMNLAIWVQFHNILISKMDNSFVNYVLMSNK